MSTVSSKIEGVLQRSEQLYQSKQYYEYSQKMKSLGNRYSSTGKNEDAIQLLSESGKKLLAVNEILEGNDLINLALDIASKMYNKENPLPGEIKERFISVYKTYPYCKQQFQFINRVLKCFFPNTGDEQIYRTVGQDLISKQKYFLAQKYVLHLNDQDLSIQVLKNFVQNKSQTEQEFIIARYVLMKLANGKLVEAEHLIQHFNLQGPIGNFLNQLRKAARLQSKICFDKLIQNYQGLLQVDSSFQQIIHQIGIQYFGVQKKQSGGLLSGLLN